jgi:hypothetical protein
VAVLERIKERTKQDRRDTRQLWRETGFVFVTDVGEPCDPRNALRALKSSADKAGLENIGLHTLRHSAASVMLNNGVPITVVSQILGHSGISITVDVYGHVAPDVSRGALDVLAAARLLRRARTGAGALNIRTRIRTRNAKRPLPPILTDHRKRPLTRRFTPRVRGRSVFSWRGRA